jgi:hypothetical protein
LDDPNLAIRLRHGRACLFDALQMVSSGSVARAAVSTVLSGFTQYAARIMR